LRVKDQTDAMVEPNTSKALPTDDLKSKSILSEYLEILRILKEENFNKTRAADRLQITRKTLYNKLKTFNSLYTGMEN
jgi:two-component system response regulator HydG